MKKLEIKSTLIGFLAALCLVSIINAGTVEDIEERRFEAYKGEGNRFLILDKEFGDFVHNFKEVTLSNKSNNVWEYVSFRKIEKEQKRQSTE